MRIKLLVSQTELLNMKAEKLQQALFILNKTKRDCDNTLNTIAKEHGINQKEFNKWKVTKDNKYLVSAEAKKTFPSKKNKGKS